MQNTAGSWSDLGMGTTPRDNRGLGSALSAGWSFGANPPAGGKGSPLNYLIDRISCCPWPAAAGSFVQFPNTTLETKPTDLPRIARPLYTAEERLRRDATPWTLVQGILAPIQFLVFLISAGLVLNYLITGNGYASATVSIVVKTLLLYTIMITGSIWEKKVFGRYLFAPSFFWEDAVSMLVLALHTAYLVALFTDVGSNDARMRLALAAYTTYVINATQFVLKLRAARLAAPRAQVPAGGSAA